MNVIQSYLTTIMKGNFSLYEIRIFVKIVEQANAVLRGTKISRLLGKAVCVDGINCNLSIPVKSVMTKGSHDYVNVKEALNRLLKKEVEIYDTDKRTWCKATLINNIRVAEGDGLIKFTVPKWLMEYILNFVYGNFSEYNLMAALTLPSAYAVRMYWLTCSMTSPVRYSVTMLRDMLGVGDKYRETKDFIKRCIEPPRKMLEERKLNGYTFTKGFNKGKVTYLQFKPVKREKKAEAQIAAQGSLSAYCNPALRQYLLSQCGFSMRELSAHKELLGEFSKIPDMEDKIVEIVERARRKRAGKGYVISAMKKSLSDTPKNAIARHVLQQMSNKISLHEENQ